MTPTTATTPTIPIKHREGCPVANGQQAAHGRRRGIALEAYVVDGPGRYDRATGSYGPPGRAGVVRCIECAEQSLIPAESVPEMQRLIVAQGTAS